MTTNKTNAVKILDNGNALVTKAFAKQARIFGTPEYKKWKEIKADLPNAQMVTKKIKKNPDKKTNRNKTYENMELFIRQQENAEELLAMFETAKIMSKPLASPYAYVVDWFRTQFPNYKNGKMLATASNADIIPLPDISTYKQKENTEEKAS